MNETLLNWAGNYTYRASRLHRPEGLSELQELVRGAAKCKALGTRHSFNDIADSTGELISLEHLNRIIELDAGRGTVTIEAGVRYGELCRYLHGAGWALHNLASLPHISVVGACATATHGSGDMQGNLATAISALEMITASGEIVSLSRDVDAGEFEGAVVGLGALGIVTKLVLDVLPAFEMRQDVYENLPLERCEQHFDELTSSGYSVSFFTDWRAAVFHQVWVKRRVEGADPWDAPSELFGARPATRPLHPIASLPAENCTEQMGEPGPWHERLPHFKLDFTPSSGEELQSEYILPREHAYDAFRAIHSLRDRVRPILQISEVRTVAADDLWMSPSYEQASVGIHFTWHKDWEAVRQVLPLIEKELASLKARPHWGKLFSMPPDQLQSLYPKLPDFQKLLQKYDPNGKFRNAFLEKYIFGEG